MDTGFRLTTRRDNEKFQYFQAFNVSVKKLAKEQNRVVFIEAAFKSFGENKLGTKSNVLVKSRKLGIMKFKELTDAFWLFIQIITNTRTMNVIREFEKLYERVVESELNLSEHLGEPH